MASGKLRPTEQAPESDEDAAVESALAGRVYVDVVVPRTKVAGKMRLVGRAEALRIVGEARETFKAAKLPAEPGSLAAASLLDEWNAEIAVRHLAVAVRQPGDGETPALATLAEWRECADDQIGALWERYKDLQDRHDPLAKTELTEGEFDAIDRAAKKKPEEADLLTSYGSRRLALYIITSVARQSISPTPK